MPTYQYACTEAECGHVFEQFQSFSDESLTVCPQCEGRLRKVFNAVGVVFKGSGFYRTDSRSDGAAATGPEKPQTSSSDKTRPASETTSGSSGSSSTPSSTTSSPSTAPAGAGAA